MRTETTPARSEARAPQIIRDNTSRPISSVPNRCCADGGLRMADQSVSIGPGADSTGARRATRRKKLTDSAAKQRRRVPPEFLPHPISLSEGDLITDEQEELLAALPPAIAERDAMISACLAYAKACLPRARKLALAWGVDWPERFEAATRDHWAISWALIDPTLWIDCHQRTAASPAFAGLRGCRVRLSVNAVADIGFPSLVSVRPGLLASQHEPIENAANSW